MGAWSRSGQATAQQLAAACPGRQARADQAIESGFVTVFVFGGFRVKLGITAQAAWRLSSVALGVVSSNSERSI